VPYTHINANARLGLELQDNTFAPNTGDPNPPASALGPGLAESGYTAGNKHRLPQYRWRKFFSLNSARHRIPFTDVNTRIYLWARPVVASSLNQNTWVNVTARTGGFERFHPDRARPSVVPQDWLKQNAGAEVSYRFC